MRRILATAGLAVGLAVSLAPSASADPAICDPYLPQKPICVPSPCRTAAFAVSTVNDAAGDPLGGDTFPNCID